MPKNEHIRRILDTYDIPPHLKDKIEIRAMEELGPIGDITYYVYRVIDNLVNVSQASNNENRAIRLDAPVSSRRIFVDPDNFSDKFTYHEVIGRDDKYLMHLLTNGDKEPNPYVENNLAAAVDTLCGILDETQKNLLREFFNSSDANPFTTITISSVGSDDQILEALSRWKEFSGRFERGGRIVMPIRPIAEVKWVPHRLEIRYSPRNYHGNPLKFFLDNIAVYGGLKRAGLSNFDRGLYQALVYHGQLEEAIPFADGRYVELGRRLGKREIPILGDNEINQIVEYYSKCNGSAYQTAKHFNRARQTIIDVWRRTGLEPMGKVNQQSTDEDISNIVSLHTKWSGNASEAARNSSYSKTTILKYWHLHDLNAVGKPRSKPNNN